MRRVVLLVSIDFGVLTVGGIFNSAASELVIDPEIELPKCHTQKCRKESVSHRDTQLTPSDWYKASNYFWKQQNMQIFSHCK